MRPGALALAALAAALIAGPAAADPACRAAIETVSASGALPRTAARLAQGGPVRIVVVGSSTTAGFGDGSAGGYGQRIGPLMRARFPGTEPQIVVAGVLGETAGGALARLPDLIAGQRPDLVVWQLGTNDANFGVAAERVREHMRSGIGLARKGGADLMFIDPQFYPGAAGRPLYDAIVVAIREEAARAGLPIVRRSDAMRRLDSATLGRWLSMDQFHLSDLGHHCMAVQTVETIARVARRGPRTGS